MKRFLVKSFLIAVCAVSVCAEAITPTTQPTPKAAARAAQLKTNIKSFSLSLMFHGDQDKPYYGLTLVLQEGVVRRLENPFQPVVTVTPQQAESIIDHFANEGFLDQAIDAGNKKIPAPEMPCYTMSLFDEDEAGKHELYGELGWGLSLLGRLDKLRAVLDGDAAKNMDLLLGRMSGHRSEWEKQAAEATAAIERLRTRLSADHLWENGISPVIKLPPQSSTEQLVSKVFEMISFNEGRVRRHRIVVEKVVQIQGSLPDSYTAVFVETNLGDKIVLLKHRGEAAGWWSRVYDSDSSTTPALVEKKKD